ncbi:site-specific integrase [bacterium]|nr:site-specific integrase [bacterium]
MAALRKLKGKWYIRVRLPNAREKLIGTGTSDEREAKRLMRLVQEKEFMVKAKLIDEFELEPLTLREAKDRFRTHCKRKNLREESIRSYSTSIENLFEVISPSSSVRALNKHVVQKLQESLSDRDLKETSININLRSVRAFINWLYREKLIPEPIEIDFLKEDRNLPKLLLPDELDKIYAKCTDDKMRATFRVYEHLGIRLGELHQCVRDGNFVRVTA